MKTIWKYELRVDDHQVLRMPEDAVILDVQVQHGTPCLWALLTPDAPKKDFKISTHGTGHDVDSNIGEHCGTYQLHNGALVFHVFKSV